jgi:DnaJ family protein C protein 11
LIEDPENLVPHDALSRLQRAGPGQILLRHSFETPINQSTQFMVEGTMAARGGAGGANISGTIKHQFSPRLWMQVSTLWRACCC